MKKKTNKKVKKISEPYMLEMIFNGVTFSRNTFDLKRAIIALKPEQLLTESYIIITKGDALFERKLTLVQGRKLFNDEQNLDIFINNLLF